MGLPVARICSGAAIRPQAPFPKPQTICRNEQFDDPLSISSKKTVGNRRLRCFAAAPLCCRFAGATTRSVHIAIMRQLVQAFLSDGSQSDPQ